MKFRNIITDQLLEEGFKDPKVKKALGDYLKNQHGV
jgi:hypothetical protein